jgi:ankyrin repeat protein
MNHHLIPLIVIAMLLTACGKDAEEARKDLAEDNIPVTQETLLKATKQADDEGTAELLVIAGVDPNARQANGMTALTSAAYNGQEDTVEALLDKGAAINLEGGGYTPLLAAVYAGREDIVELLIQAGRRRQPPERHGHEPAQSAAKDSNKPKIAKLLIEAGAKP